MNPAPFRFRLERVRALRERTEDLAQEAYAASLTHRMRGEAMLRAAGERVEAARTATRTLGSQPATSDDLLAAHAYLQRTEMARRAAALDLGRRDADLGARRAALAAAARERKVLDRLRDRRHAAHRAEALRLEGVALDDMTAARHRPEGSAR